MLYKTMMLELLEQRPQMYEQLRKERKLLPAMELYARELKRMHEAWKVTLLTPDSDPAQTSSLALEMALQEMEHHLPSRPETDGVEALSLDEAMAFIRSHTPRR